VFEINMAKKVANTKIDEIFSTAHIFHGALWEEGGKGDLAEVSGAPERHWGPRAAAEAAGDCAAKDLRIGGRRADTNPIPVYLNHALSTSKGGHWAVCGRLLPPRTPYVIRL
jgi:hypothetical protein